jgi:hypothetical protein
MGLGDVPGLFKIQLHDIIIFADGYLIERLVISVTVHLVTTGGKTYLPI